MASLVEEIVLTLGLDTGLLKKALVEAGDVIKKLFEGFEKHAKDFLAGNLKMTAALGDLAMGLTRVAGAVGLVSAALAKMGLDAVKTTLATSNLAKVLDMSPDSLYKFGRAVESFGGNAQSASQGLLNMRMNMLQLTDPGHFGQPDPKIAKYFNQADPQYYLGLSKNASQMEVLGKLLDKIKDKQLNAQVVARDWGIDVNTMGALAGHTMGELTERMKTYSTMTAEQIKAANDWQQALTKLEDAVFAMKNAFETLADSLGFLKVIEQFTSLLNGITNTVGMFQGGHWDPKTGLWQLGPSPKAGGAAPGTSPGTSTGGGGTPSSDLQGDRQKFKSELDADPALKQDLFDLAEAETGGQGSTTKQAFIESVMNRASARGQTLRQAVHDSGYYPKTTTSKVGAGGGPQVNDILNTVFSGSNVSGYATGNASGTVGFAGGPQTYNPGTGERFGIEKSDIRWAAGMRERERNAGSSPVLEQGGNFLTGTVDVEGNKFPFGSGGAGRRHIPYGDYPITPGTVGSWGAAHGALGINNNQIWDPVLGRMRDGIELHAGMSDHAITAGCIAIAGNRWPEFKAKVLAMIARNGSAYLHVGADGVSISPTKQAAEAERRRMGSTQTPAVGAGTLPMLSHALPPVPTRGASPSDVSKVDNSKITVGAMHFNTGDSPAVDEYLKPHHAGYQVQDSSAAIKMRDYAVHDDSTLE
jgi:hypothetical protein